MRARANALRGDIGLSINITVAYALPDVQYDEPLELESGATVADALAAIAQQPPFNELDLSEAPVGVFNRLVKDRSQALHDGDRVEIYRQLELDPMTARQQRAAVRRA